jgi:hypothetical protein
MSGVLSDGKGIRWESIDVKHTGYTILRGGADRSLARPGRKQATATKLGFIQHNPHEAQYTS